MKMAGLSALPLLHKRELQILAQKISTLSHKQNAGTAKDIEKFHLLSVHSQNELKPFNLKYLSKTKVEARDMGWHIVKGKKLRQF